MAEGSPGALADVLGLVRDDLGTFGVPEQLLLQHLQTLVCFLVGTTCLVEFQRSGEELIADGFVGHWMESKWMFCPACPPLFPQTVREKRGEIEGRVRQKGRDTPSAPRNRTSASSGGVGVALSGKKALTRSLPIRRRDFTQPTSSASSVIRLALWPVCRSAPISRKR